MGKLPDRGNSRCKGPKEETHLQPKNIQVAGVASKGKTKREGQRDVGGGAVGLYQPEVGPGLYSKCNWELMEDATPGSDMTVSRQERK